MTARWLYNVELAESNKKPGAVVRMQKTALASLCQKRGKE